jgi:aspartate/methionine/tyrosine aminotransferase
MHPLADELNQKILAESPVTYALLSERGRKLYFPKGILSQSAEAKEKAHRFNATIGEATEGTGPMALRSVLRHIADISPADALRYAPAPGRPDLRQAWKQKLLAENPTLRERTFSLPIVTHAITHGLALVGDLFIDPGDRVLIPDMLWDNYALNFETRLGGVVETFPTYDGQRFNVPAMRQALLAGPTKQMLVLNFPNNPTGYMPSPGEVADMREAVLAAANAGKKLVVVCDDAYFGLFFDDGAIQESPFGALSNLHENVLSVKLDGATKELFVWGLRCGFLSIALPPGGNADVVLGALERKLMGAIRAGISNCSSLSQSIVLSALRSPSLPGERAEKLEILKARAVRVREVVYRDKYRALWDVYPFNAGYFMCIRVKGPDAEKLRLHLLEKYGVGVIAMGKTDIRVAFSCLELEQIEPLFECVADAIRDLESA